MSVSDSLYTRFASSWIFPLHERLKGHDSVARLRELERTQWLSREQIEDLRFEKLRGFLLRIGESVPYYRELFRSQGIDPRIQSPADLRKVPFLTKPLVRANLERIRAEDAGPVTLYNTGGSTGEPLQFYIGKARKSHDVASKWRATRWWGVDIGDPEIVIWGSPVELGAQDRVRELRDRLLRTKLLPAFEMSEEGLDGFIASIQLFRPRMLFGYSSSLSLIAERARARGLDLTTLGVKVAFVTAEQLLDEHKRSIEDGFACRVANGYGGRDLGFVAHQCDQGGMHVTAEDMVVEIVDENGDPVPDGEQGEIVVTHLQTPDFPFVRYRSGDLGVLSKDRCPCGRGLPLLDSVSGRTTDFVVAQDGTVMHALAMIYAVRDVPGVLSFKIVQESLALTRLLLVAPELDAETEKSICERLRQRLGAEVEVVVERVTEIPRSRSGKHRYVESRVELSPRGSDATARASSAPTP